MKTLFLAATLLFSGSVVCVGSAAAEGPNDVYMATAATADIEDAAADAGNSGVSASDAQAARDAADDREVARLMAEATDEGNFGDSIIVDKSGVEIRVSGFGFNDK